MPIPELDPAAFARARAWLEQADALVVAAGAGMGIDSGLPDFRGPQGFWRAYPALGRARLNFEEIASPAAFRRDPRLAWGFYGHRLALYRATVPHAGFALLQRLGADLPGGCFVFTSNVDGQFQRAGFAESALCEVHGSLHHLQCLDGCDAGIWPAADFAPQVDAEACRLLGDLPRCPGCGALARPNVLMFGDAEWRAERTAAQQRRLRDWLGRAERPVVIELGAGTRVPTVRWFAESLGVPLLRINPDEPGVAGARAVGLAVGALEGLRQLLG